MNLDVLKKLSTDNLKLLVEGANTELSLRIDTRLQIGRTTIFTCSDGHVRTCQVERINQKTVQIREDSSSFKPGSQWKIDRRTAERGVVGIEKASIVRPHVEKPHEIVGEYKSAW